MKTPTKRRRPGRPPKGKSATTRTIRINEPVWNVIRERGRGFETPNDVLCRLLGLTIACPACGERDHDRLDWVTDGDPTGKLKCACGHVFRAERGVKPEAESWDRLLAAATALLDARTNQMVTAAEWRALRAATLACGGTVDPDDAEVDDAGSA